MMYSSHAKFFISGRSEDVILLTETHQNKTETLAMVKEISSMGWTATASPAMLTDRSETGTMAGVVSAIAPYIDNRPSSFCKDDKGQLTGNPFVTTRTMTLEMVEVQALAGYLQCGGLKGDNLRTLTQVDLITRGGRDLFFLGPRWERPPWRLEKPNDRRQELAGLYERRNLGGRQFLLHM